MAQDVKIANITYSDVPAIEIPKATTGTALFTDTSPTTAVASDVASGKYFFTASGQLTLGSASGGTAAISVVDTTDTAGGTIRTITALDISDTTAVASDVASGKYFYTAGGTKTAGTASGGSGLEYETGTWTPTEDVQDPVILFSNQHDRTPFYVITFDVNTALPTDSYEVSSITLYDSTASTILTGYYGYAFFKYNGGSGASTSIGRTAVSNWITNQQFRPSYNRTSSYWRTGRTYKWIAVWAPTT